MPDVHAKRFSPSASCKWINCPGSVLLEAEYPDRETDYTREGTLAHSIGELKLSRYFSAMSRSDYNARLNDLKQDPLYQKEMDGYTDRYLEYVQSIAMQFSSIPTVAIEKQVDFSSYAPGGFGTSDCIVIGDNTMYVIDLKYGKGVSVSAEQNTQGMLYALGALLSYRMFYQINDIVIAIVQPRLDNISEWRVPVSQLIMWTDSTLKDAVTRVMQRDTVCVPGPWCDKGFCKARGKCAALAKKNLDLQAEYNLASGAELTLAQVGEALTKGRQLKSWLTQLESYALSKCLAGDTIPGWKAVAGRSVRQFTDVDAAFKRITDSGIDAAMLYKQVPITLTEAEKLVGKKKFETLTQGYVVKSEPKPTLAEESDKRAVYQPANAASDFAGII